MQNNTNSMSHTSIKLSLWLLRSATLSRWCQNLLHTVCVWYNQFCLNREPSGRYNFPHTHWIFILWTLENCSPANLLLSLRARHLYWSYILKIGLVLITSKLLLSRMTISYKQYKLELEAEVWYPAVSLLTLHVQVPLSLGDSVLYLQPSPQALLYVHFFRYLEKKTPLVYFLGFLKWKIVIIKIFESYYISHTQNCNKGKQEYAEMLRIQGSLPWKLNFVL